LSAIYERLGLAPAVNARGTYSDLGGSRLSPGVLRAMEESNRAFIEMEDLLQKSGAAVATLLGVEAARVTPGAAASLALCAAACVTRGDGKAIERLPDTTGLPNEIIIQHAHRYKYDRCLRLAGIGFVEPAGASVTADTLAAAINAKTAAIIHPAHLNDVPGSLSLEKVAAIARSRDIPVIVDAAYKVEPPVDIRSWLERGADVVCISAKYFSGPNAGGFVFGRRRVIDWIAACDFTGFESSDYLTFGRVFKLDRQIVCGVVEALREWMALDFDARYRQYGEQVKNLTKSLAGYPGLTLVPRFFTMEETLEQGPTNSLEVLLPSGVDPQQLRKRLSERPQRVLLHAYENSIAAAMETLLPGEEDIVGRRIREELDLIAGEAAGFGRRTGR
jgi:L-seryl-tRNA(Ser) seleniumtransferase